MTALSLPGLRAGYRSGERVRLRGLPAGTQQVIARSAFGQAVRVGPEAELPPLGPGTYAVEAWSATGLLLAEDFTTLEERPGERPVPGFVSSFRPEAVAPSLAWLRALRCTSVQFYDWMQTYADPLAGRDDYADRLGRRHSLAAIRELTAGCRELGAVPQAYAPVYAADPDFGRAHPDLLLYRGDGEPERLGGLLQVTDPGSPEWQRHWVSAYGTAADKLGFGGFHLDTYGYPRQPLDQAGRPVPMAAAHACFLRAVRTARPGDVLSFNQVNGEPRTLPLPGPPGFRYIEVWPPNDRWRHLEGLLARSSAAGVPEPYQVLALYPPVWDTDRAGALRTVVRTEAVVTALGASLLVYGDERGALRHPYYPDYERLAVAESEQVLDWHRFALRCRDLLAGGTDTSWTDIGDENGAVSVRWPGQVSPEPAGGAVCARVVRHDDCIAVSVLDLTGSDDGSWRSPTAAGRCSGVTVSVLLGVPERWTADAAVLGRNGGRFAPVPARQAGHQEGLALEVELPVAVGWSVLRVSRS
jgi:dextranase